ncbi:MAG: putative baseplate assembly protein, partial [Anaerolineae bacterium]
PPEPARRERKLHLQVGDVLIFEEVIGPETGNPNDADPTHRHAVRLTRVDPAVDPLFDQPVVEIAWAEEDALPFPVCISTIGPAPACEHLDHVSVARGNVILVDHGARVADEALGTVGTRSTTQICKGEGRPSNVTTVPDRFSPVLERGPLTFSQPLQAGRPASQALMQDPRRALPQIRLSGTYNAPSGEVIRQWTARQGLLGSHGFDRHFVVEMDDTGRAHLRFGDGELGLTPEAGTTFIATYRVGNGPVGNVGAEAISHIVFHRDRPSGIDLRPRNPLPAQGGIAPETIAEVKLLAPFAFRTELQRAITPDDYAHIVMRDFKTHVQGAAATLRWTGSWYEVLVAIDPRGGTSAPPGLLERIESHLYRCRRIGHDVVVRLAHTVPLDVELTICVSPDHLRGHVKAALLDVFGKRRLPDGELGFFHPDRLTFGEGITVSGLVATAQAVAGVVNAVVTRLERLYEGSNGEIEAGILPLNPFEVARLDNDPSFPENGQFRLEMRGGR